MSYQVRSGSHVTILGEGEVVIGRSAYCSLIVEHGSVSRIHARLYRVEGGLEVSDLGSSYGTFVNGRRISAPVRVTPDDDIRVGQQPIVLELCNARQTRITVADRGREPDNTRVSPGELS